MMKFKIKSAIAALSVLVAAAGCTIKNDMMLPTDPAGFESFEIKDQISSSINTQKRLITVTMAHDTTLNALTVSKISYNEATRLSDDLPMEGTVLDLSDTLRITLTAYREFEWKLIAKNAPAPLPDPEPGPTPDPTPDPEPTGAQLYNMSFDFWTMSGKGWYPYGAEASDEEKSIWATSNKGTAETLGRNATTPETSFLALSGDGKQAAKLTSQTINVVITKKFAAGNLFTGEFCGLKGLSGADLAWGVPFTDRPKSLHGHYCYQPATIDMTDSAHSSLKGQGDSGHILVILADWDKDNRWEGYGEGAIDDQGRFHVINSDNQFVDIDNDPAIIGYGSMVFDRHMDAYEEFSIPIEYRNSRTPKVVVIVAASSRYGDYFTGGSGTALYLDEFEFKY